MPLTSHNHLSKTLPPYLADRVSQTTRRQQQQKSDDSLLTSSSKEDENKQDRLWATITESTGRPESSSFYLHSNSNNVQAVPHSKIDYQAVASGVTNQIQRISGTKRESPRSRASSRASDIKESANAVIRPRPIKQSPRTMTSLDHVDLWETSDGDDDDNVDDVCSSSNGFTAVPTSSNSSTPTIPNTVHLFHPLRIDDLEDTTGLVRRSFSPVVCKRNRVESNNREREATQSRPQSRQSVISPRDHRSRPRSRCGRRENMGSASVTGPEMSVESPKIHDSTNTLRLFYQQHPNSVYSPVTDSKVFSDRRGGSTVHRKNAWTAIPAQPTTVVFNKEASSNDSEKQIAKKSGDEQQHDKKVASTSSKTVKYKSTLPDPFRTQTLATNFGLRASYSFEDTSRQKVPHYLVKKVTFNRVVNVKDGEQSIHEDLRSSNNSAQTIKAKHLPVIGRKSNSVVQSGTPIKSC